MRILSWNVNQGRDCPDLMVIIDALQERNPEVIFLQDFLNNHHGQIIRNAMKEIGYEHQYFTGEGSISGIQILSRKNFSLNRCNYIKPLKSCGWLDIMFNDYRVSILSVNMPQTSHNPNSNEYWERLLEYSKIKTIDDCIIIGTLCPNNNKYTDAQQHPIKEIIDTGWVDLIQYYQNKKRCVVKEYKNSSRRMDYALATKMVRESVLTAYFSDLNSGGNNMRTPIVLELA
jgi:exonuclease III